MSLVNDGWIKTTCAYCGVGCGVEARPKLSGDLEIRGDKSHPSNYGKLCTKGIALGDTVIHDGRLLTPIEKSQSGDNVLDWDSATQLVADKFSHAIERYGPDSVAFYVSGQLLTEDYYVANKLMKGFIGASNIDSNSRLCMASSVVGHKRAFGSDTVPICYEDLEHADMVVLVGSNLAWCHPVLFQRLRTAKQINPDVKIVVIDPRETENSTIADYHLALNSGSDVALFNGLLHFLNKNDHLDHDFIQSSTNQINHALSAAESDDDLLESATGLTRKQLNRFYQDFASSDKVITVYSQGVNQSSIGSDKVNSILNCHLATGKIGQVGSGPFSVTGQPNAMGGREVGALANTLASHMEFDNSEHHALIREFWQTDRLATKPGLKAVDLFDAMAEGKIKAVWIMATNPMVSLPDSAKVKAALEACPFVVVSDCIADTETARMADLLLPAQGWSEKSGTVTNSERRISRQRRIMPSPGMAKPDWWIISQVARKMGYHDAFRYRHEGQIFAEYAQLSTLGNNNGERDFTLSGLTQLDEQGYNLLTPQQWPVTQLQTEITNQRLFSNGEFYTANRKANFVAVHHREPHTTCNDNFPLLLNSGRTRDQWHTMSRTGLSARLAEHKPEPYVQIHPTTAKERGVKAHQLVKLHNAQGECLARAEISEQIQPNQLFLPIHWNNATAKNSKPCNLIAPHTDSHSGQPEFKHTPVALSVCKHQSRATFASRAALTFDSLDYWARQKIAEGYLYHIESTLSTGELASYLKSRLSTRSDKVVSHEAGERYRFITLAKGKVMQAIYVEPLQNDHAVNEQSSILTARFSADNESQILAAL
ncbi:molybdopterin oxidoreductase family protein [Vibrio nereis]|uniref:Nitrate reductase n=1 Tax=Vibrio nereis TaxID=693 RepID=A0A0M0HM97_VIBNE|nr:nitrate reductase [Vibrio nereis]KOO03195.1 nitrate reductase [Vibrio nereis]